MTAALDHDDLHHLVDRLTPDQVRAVRAVVLELVRSAPADSRVEEWPPSWFGAIRSNRDDTAARTDEILREEFGRAE